MDEVSRTGSTRRARLGRRLSRRLSLVAKVPNIIGVRLRQEFGSSSSLSSTVNKSQQLTVIAPDKSQRILKGCSPETVSQLLGPLGDEFGISGWPDVRLAGSQAEVDPEADVLLLEAEILIVNVPPPPSLSGDRVKDLSIKWLEEERKHVSRMRSSVPLYGSPLTNLGVLAPAEFSKLCQPLAALAETCQSAVTMMKELIDNWDYGRRRLGGVFDDRFWEQYDSYQNTYRSAMQLLRDKARNDDDFVELCKLRRGAAKYGLPDLLHLPAIDLESRSVGISCLKFVCLRSRTELCSLSVSNVSEGPPSPNMETVCPTWKREPQDVPEDVHNCK